MDRAALKARTIKVFAGIKDANTVIIANSDYQDPNFLYLTDLKSGLFEGSLVVLKKDNAMLLTSPLEYEDALKGVPKGMQVIKIDSADKAKKILTKAVKGKNIGMNEDFVTYAMHIRFDKKYRPSKMVDVSAAFENARMTKDKYEISEIRKAVRITKGAQREIQKFFKKGITEKQLADKFNDIAARLGAKKPSFDTIVCFGANASMPHHSPDGTRLKYGDFVLIDAGSKVGNYCSDITRTYIFGNDKNKIKDYAKKREIYNLVKQAQTRAIKAIKPGAKGADIHKIAEDCINKYKGGKYKGTFIHSLGHSIGLEVHDGSGRVLTPGSELTLKEGIITSVEPGIYLPGFGGVRIEDDILVTKKGALIL